MNVTDKVKIGAIVYKVELCKNIIQDAKELDGQIDYGKQTIKLSQDLFGRYKEEVFLHEIIHGVLDFCNVPNEEDFVQRLTKSFHQVIADNPTIFCPQHEPVKEGT